MEIKFIEYNGIEGYIELMKHDVEPLNNPDCKSIELYYDGKDIKAVLDYITNLQEEIHKKEAMYDNLAVDYRLSQEENERLKKQLEYLRSGEYLNQIKWERDFLQSIVDEKDIDYKLRCEKAISLLKEAGCYDEKTKTFCDDVWEELPELLNILTGGDKE